MLVNCYICGAKTSIPLLPIALGDRKIMCDKCRDKYINRNKMTSTDNNDRCVVCFERKPKEVNRKYGDNFCVRCSKAVFGDMKNQSAKADSGKPNLSLVPKQIIYEIEKVRDFGVRKYKEPDNWKKVELERYHEALLRHTLAIWNDINARDKESGLLHLSHIATNVAFILELMNDKE